MSPGIDSNESIPPANVACRAGTSNRVVVSARQAGNRFLVSLKGLQIRTLESCLEIQGVWRLLDEQNIEKGEKIYSWGHCGKLNEQVLLHLFSNFSRTCFEVKIIYNYRHKDVSLGVYSPGM
jgi:hypothetical protein